jgi:hypothetical protein
MGCGGATAATGTRGFGRGFRATLAGLSGAAFVGTVCFEEARGRRGGTAFAGFFLLRVILRTGFLAAGRLPDFFAAAGALGVVTLRDRFGRVADRIFASRAAFSARLRRRLAVLTAARARLSCSLACFKCSLAALTPFGAFAAADLVLFMCCVPRLTSCRHDDTVCAGNCYSVPFWNISGKPPVTPEWSERDVEATDSPAVQSGAWRSSRHCQQVNTRSTKDG